MLAVKFHPTLSCMGNRDAKSGDLPTAAKVHVGWYSERAAKDNVLFCIDVVSLWINDYWAVLAAPPLFGKLAERSIAVGC